MTTLLMLSPIVIGVAVVLGLLWLERLTKHAGLMSAIAGIASLLAGAVQLFMSPRFLSALFVVQGIAFLVFYRARRATAR